MTRGRLAFALAALAAAPLAQAQDEGGYLGAALGQSRLKEWCSPGLTSCEDTDTAWKRFGGYRFNRYVAAEVSYIDWGETTASSAAAQASAEQQSYGIAGIASLRLGAQFDAFGKVGYLHTEQKTRSPASTVSRDDNEFHFGLGARFLVAPHWAVRAEWENTDKLKVEMLSVGAEYRF